MLTPVTTVNQAIDRIIAREHDEIATIRHYNPLIETYVQDMKPDEDMGAIPVHDHYYLGQANLIKGVVDDSMLTEEKGRRFDEFNPLYHVSGLFKADFVPEGFLQMIYIDTNGFDRQHYQFDYVRTEFLGDVKCVVFDVTPLPKSGRGRFKGRIWAENQDYTIVRFNGVYTPVAGINGFNLHFDSWRLNLQPGLWLPAFIFSQESDLRRFSWRARTFQVADPPVGLRSEERQPRDRIQRAHDRITRPHVGPGAGAADRIVPRSKPSANGSIRPRSTCSTGCSAADCLHLREKSTKFSKPSSTISKSQTISTSSRKFTAAFFSPARSNPSPSATPSCSAAACSTFLPDEASLATMLAQELANIIVTKPTTDQWGFNDTTNVSTVEALSHFSFQDNPAQVQKASEKAVELLKNSPYKDKLGNAELFLRQLDSESNRLPALINPRLGNRVNLHDAVDRFGAAAPAGQGRPDCGFADRRAHQARSMERPRRAAQGETGAALFGARKDAVRSHALYAVPDALSEAGSAVPADPAKADLAKKEQQHAAATTATATAQQQ